MNAATLYVHVPFCVVKCGYCDFNSYADHAGASHDRFLHALDLELARSAPTSPPSVFFGGGTPTFLDPQRFESLLRIVGRHVDLRACDEVSLEANPESVTREKAEIALDAGVDRFSVGAQTFDPTRLRFLDRAHDAAGSERAVRALREAGATNVSIDLMFGLPGQTPDEWRADLEHALALGPDHMSCYNLTFEPGTMLRHALERGEVAPNEPEVDLEMFDLTRDVLAGRGFHAYEISNFAGRGGPCRHNDHYWLQGDYVGVGPGAASHSAGERSTNLRVVERWATAVESGNPAYSDHEVLSPMQRAGEALWLGLRRTDGVDLAEVAARVAVDVETAFRPSIDRFLRSGLLTRQGGRIALSDPGIRIADSVTQEFLQPL